MAGFCRRVYLCGVVAAVAAPAVSGGGGDGGRQRRSTRLDDCWQHRAQRNCGLHVRSRTAKKHRRRRIYDGGGGGGASVAAAQTTIITKHRAQGLISSLPILRTTSKCKKNPLRFDELLPFPMDGKNVLRRLTFHSRTPDTPVSPVAFIVDLKMKRCASSYRSPPNNEADGITESRRWRGAEVAARRVARCPPVAQAAGIKRGIPTSMNLINNEHFYQALARYIVCMNVYAWRGP